MLLKEVDTKQSMYQFIDKYFFLNRTPVSDGINQVADGVVESIGGNIIDVASGEECLTWIIPKNWHVTAGYISTIDGTKIVDFEINPLHLWTHSISIDKLITFDELKKHLLFNTEKPDWVPYHYRNGYKYDAMEWGFCISYNQFLTMNDSEYRVFIDSTLDNNGTMKTADYHLKGTYDDTIFIAAHSCHPAIATDGLSCVAVGMEVMKELQKRENLKYSYRLIVGPEYYAAAAFLAKTPEKEISDMRCGMFLDMLGNGEVLAYQNSYSGDTLIDKIVSNIFNNNVPNHVQKPYRKLYGNDEMFYNGPGYWIPTIGIGGAHGPTYHFDQDNMINLDLEKLEESKNILTKIVDVFEQNFTPILNFKGPLYQSRYGIYIDPKIDPKGYSNIENIQILIDGKNTLLDIAVKLNIDFFFVHSFSEKLIEKNLLLRKETNIFDGANL